MFSDQILIQIQYSILDLSGIIAIIIGFVKIYGLPEKQSKQNHTLDVCLLRFGLFFNFLFFLFTSALTIFPRLHCTGGGNGPETGAANSLHLLNGLLSVLYCSLNVLFIELLLHKTIDEGDTKKPGRQVKSFQRWKPISLSGGHLPHPAQPHCVGSLHLWVAKSKDNSEGDQILWQRSRIQRRRRLNLDCHPEDPDSGHHLLQVPHPGHPRRVLEELLQKRGEIHANHNITSNN